MCLSFRQSSGVANVEAYVREPCHFQLQRAPARRPRRGLCESGRVASGAPVELTGVLERAPEIAPGGLVLSLRVESVRHKSAETSCGGRVELFAPVRDARAAKAYD